MGQLIDLLEFKKRKEEDEIEKLRQELSELIEGMGGIHIAPMMILNQTGYLPPLPESYQEEDVSLWEGPYTLPQYDLWSSPGSTTTWGFVEYTNDDKKE